MTNQQHPITPPEDLLQQLRRNTDTWLEQITIAYQAGADHELEACINFVYDNELCDPDFHNNLRAARRPKPPSLKEQALTAFHAVATGANDTREQHQDLDTIRQALEALPND